MRIYRVIVGSILVLGVFVSCATHKLERRLIPELRTWYELHLPVLENELPDWAVEALHEALPKTFGKKHVTEKQFFLRLPSVAAQAEYTRIFWNLRGGAPMAKEYYMRVSAATNVFREEAQFKGQGWKTDRGWLLLRCGFPIDIRTFRIVTTDDEQIKRPSSGGREMMLNDGLESLTADIKPDATYVQEWRYIFGKATVVVFSFVLETNKHQWRLQAPLDGTQLSFIEKQQKFFAILDNKLLAQFLLKHNLADNEQVRFYAGEDETHNDNKSVGFGMSAFNH